MLTQGDKLPLCFGMDGTGRFYSSEDQAGRPAVLVLGWQVAPDTIDDMLTGLLRRAPSFAGYGADLVVLADEDVARACRSHGVRVVDCGPQFLAQCDMTPGQAMVLVVDRGWRIAGVAMAEADGAAAMCEAWLASLPREEPQRVVLPAPVLMLPNLLSPSLCQGLIAAFESGTSIDGAVASIDSDGMPWARVDHGKKRRRDMALGPAHALFADVEPVLLDRCAPAIAAAFQARVGYTDRILIARYDETGGYFRRHRDNVATNVQFREFAISVNLNAGEYEGGELCFPEYNDHSYRPETGAGIVFSASLLHEATAVTRGRRYVLLTFFHGEAAEARRLERFQAEASAA